jgi:hypothetical protein
MHRSARSLFAQSSSETWSYTRPPYWTLPVRNLAPVMNESSKRFRTLLAWSIVISVGLALAAGSPAGATDTVVAHLQEPSSIRTYAGVQVFSVFAEGAYHLGVLRAGNVELLPVPSSPAPFAADIGPDRESRPQVIYTRCKTARRDCDLFVFSLSSGGSEQPVRGANTSANEVAPTIWKDRIVFARQTKGHRRASVYTRKLSAPLSRPSERLPACPRRCREERGKPVVVVELELSGDDLAQIVDLTVSTEVRLVDVIRHSSRLIDRAGVGEAGQHFSGIGFASGYLAWAFGGAIGENAGIYRYRLSTRERSHAPFPRVVDYNAAGLALFAANGAYIIDAQPDTGGCGGDPDAVPPVVRPCQVIRSQPLQFKRIRR